MEWSERHNTETSIYRIVYSCFVRTIREASNTSRKQIEPHTMSLHCKGLLRCPESCLLWFNWRPLPRDEIYQICTMTLLPDTRVSNQWQIDQYYSHTAHIPFCNYIHVYTCAVTINATAYINSAKLLGTQGTWYMFNHIHDHVYSNFTLSESETQCKYF